ncbi:pentapeptide repeat-containing protein [Pseudonocardia sp. MH-G8]|uniref:pentapeptide repeat-containing protein n=1 Tax=Pseudonocardia sp. MH-G8 TaxID=1854588 RepID=UPI000BA0E32C|nr:pentapeptide repeat-containing protein [Pseudonocardia sp. MH-G8]OZM80817.1 hypothetical protein CFP66_18970 [Pseudonocardia sp. MH-G8]
MARRTTRRRNRPDPPLEPEGYDPAPATVTQGAVWDCVAADDQTAVESHVTDWKIQESRLTGVDLAGRDLRGFRCRDTRFVRCDLSGAVLEGAELERVVFEECRLRGTVLDRAHLVDVHLAECSADLINLRTARAYRLLVEDSRMRAADLTNLTLAQGAVLRCDLSEAILYEAKLGRARLHGSDLSDIRNALALTGCVIGPEQQDAVGELLLAALDITITDDTITDDGAAP